MSRWEPDGRRRLQEAALELFTDQGYAATTAAAVAERAGLTERTFYRHFTDKRDVLFGAEDRLRDLLADTVTSAPATLSPRAAVAAGLDAVAVALQPLHTAQKRRAAIIDGHPDLRERELAKLTTWSAFLGNALHTRGVPPLQAEIAAELAVTVFRVAFVRWTAPAEDGTDLPTLVREATTQARTLP